MWAFKKTIYYRTRDGVSRRRALDARDMVGAAVGIAVVATRVRTLATMLRIVVGRMIVVVIRRSRGRRSVVVELLLFASAAAARRHRGVGGERLPVWVIRLTPRLQRRPQIAG